MNSQVVDVRPAEMAAFLDLEERARSVATIEELSFIIVNETLTLLPYRQACLWSDRRGMIAHSGISAFEPTAPFTTWIERVCRHADKSYTGPTPVGGADLPAVFGDEWSEWLPPHAIWIPLHPRHGNDRYGLLLARDAPWGDHEQLLLSRLGRVYEHAWSALVPWHEGRGWRAILSTARRPMVMALILVLLVGLIPVQLSVLAPAEIVPANPYVVRAPLDGVVDRIDVQPNQVVKEGQPLLQLDPAQIAAKLEVATKDLMAAEAEYRQASQQAVFDAKAKAQLAILSARFEARRAEVGYQRSLVDRIRVTSPIGGVVVVDDPTEWVGRPVSLGERVMLVAREDDTEVEAWLSIGDAIDLPVGTPVSIFLDSDPLHPAQAVVRYVAYEATLRPNSTVAYRVRATLVDGAQKPRLGLRGTARLETGRVPLVYSLLRRPIASVRAYIGW
jgi:multidrug efflux pump subunit AcrA (membrane-fusion protein)